MIGKQKMGVTWLGNLGNLDHPSIITPEGPFQHIKETSRRNGRSGYEKIMIRDLSTEATALGLDEGVALLALRATSTGLLKGHEGAWPRVLIH